MYLLLFAKTVCAFTHFNCLLGYCVEGGDILSGGPANI
jgi:hypothetical protein